MDAGVAAAIGWYGPLIDLSSSSSHTGVGFVQLLVFVHASRPFQIDSNGRALSWVKCLVGDGTLAHFSVTVKQKHLGSMIAAGDIVLLQNVKIVKYREIIEATTVEVSSVIVLVHLFKLRALQGASELIANCQVGTTVKEKLEKVIEWVRQTESLLQNTPQIIPHSKNWKSCEDNASWNCISVSEIAFLTSSCKVNFHAHIGGIFMIDSLTIYGFDKQKNCIKRQIFDLPCDKIVDDLVCIGCKLCGFPLFSSFLPDQRNASFYCQKSSNHVHIPGCIYKPFLIRVRDQTGELSVLVKNNAAEVLFGNIAAENMMTCYKTKERVKMHYSESFTCHSGKIPNSELPFTEDFAEGKQQQRNTALPNAALFHGKPDFHSIWLLLLKSLLLQGKNSSFMFEVAVNPEEDFSNGRFELMNFRMPRPYL